MEVSGKIKWLDETKTGTNGLGKERSLLRQRSNILNILLEFIQDKCDC